MIIIKSPKTKDEFKAYYALRYKVLREPYGEPKGTEKDDFEPISQHFMAVDSETGELVGTVKMFEKEPGVCQFSHMAVLQSRQRQGIGRVLIETVETAARNQGYTVIGSISRLTATRFFEKYHYQIKGLPVHYFGTTQMVWMEKKLG